MSKRMLVLALLPLQVVVLAGLSQAWQGRMEGMGGPYGLMGDESDFLIHPAKIAKGEAVRFYGYYRFTYTGLTKWDRDIGVFDAAGTPLICVHDNDDSSDEYRHNPLLGAAFPLGPGRMGIFYEYTGMRGNYDLDRATENFLVPTIYYGEYDIRNELDDFAVRLLYGLPMDGINLGGEIQFSYRQERSTLRFQAADLSSGGLSHHFYWRFTPYDDSDYWEALLKGSIEGMVGPLDVEFTLLEGFIFAGDNAFEYVSQSPVGTTNWSYDLYGGLNGWQIGGDLWARYSLGGGLTLPFLVGIDYQEKTWDGDGPGVIGYVNNEYFDYERERRDFALTVGGGVDKELNAGTRIAGGIYYGYLQNNLSQWNLQTLYAPTLEWNVDDYSENPLYTEHQVMVRFAGEHEFSPLVALRMGLGFFYGWARQDVESTSIQTIGGNIYTRDYSYGGYHWGIGASLGERMKFQRFTLEPFINTSYQSLDLDGDGNLVLNSSLLNLIEQDETLSEWSIGMGLSLLFDVP